MALSSDITRDVYLQKKADNLNCLLDPALLAAGWVGGQNLAFKDSKIVDGYPKPVVGLGNGIQRGVTALWGSDELEDKLQSYTKHQLVHPHVQCIYGGVVFVTRNFEVDSYFSRTSLSTFTDFNSVVHAVLVAAPSVLTYTAGDPLFFSERGLLTKEQITIAHQVVGYSWQIPAAGNSGFLGFSGSA